MAVECFGGANLDDITETAGLYNRLAYPGLK